MFRTTLEAWPRPYPSLHWKSSEPNGYDVAVKVTGQEMEGVDGTAFISETARALCRTDVVTSES